MTKTKIHKGRQAVCPVCNPEAARKYQAQLKRKKFQKKEDEDIDVKERADYRPRNPNRRSGYIRP